MGFKLKDGEKIHLPPAFLNAFTRYDYVPPGIDRTPEDIIKSIEDTRDVFLRHKIKIRRGNSLDQLLTRAERETRKRTKLTRTAMDLQYVIALTGLFIGLADEEGIRVPLDRIAKSEMDTGSAKFSQGKDAIWELACMANFKIGAMKVRLDEPDLVTDVGQGDYGVACKKIYSENNVEKCISNGVGQIAKAQMPGIVALNIDELVIPPGRMMYAWDQETLRGILQGYATDFMTRHRATLNKYGEDGTCDGFIISVSRAGWLLDRQHFAYISVNVHSPAKGVLAPGSVRMDQMGRLTSNAEGLEDWVAKVGGKAFGL